MIAPLGLDAAPPAILLIGPTATGKTELAVALASALPVDIISVDSAQIYRGMDIGTAKPEPALRARAPHRLIDIRDPAESYSVADFLADAHREMASITAAGRVPLLVGGTMQWFRALLDGLADLPPGCPEFRRGLIAEAERGGWPALHSRLMRLDPETAAGLHPNHSQRIQRALEVIHLTGVPLSVLRRQPSAGDRGTPPLTKRYRVVQLLLVPEERALLHRRIEIRLARMMELGFVAEVEKLHERGDLSPDLPALRAVGYRQVWGHLAGAFGYQEMWARALAATRQLGKRQCTWLRSWPEYSDVQRLPPVGAARSLSELQTQVIQNLRTGGIFS